MKYKEFKVVVESRTSIEIIKPNNLTLIGDVRIDPLTERTIDIFSKWLAEDKIKMREELVVLGSYLFNVLFDKETRKEFKREYDKIRGQLSEGLRVILEFKPDARDLAVMPWEYIYYPDSAEEGRGFFIATDNQLILTRHVPLKIKGLEPGPRPLRILIVVSTPKRDTDGKEMNIVKAEPVINTIEGLKNGLQDAIQIDKLTQPTKTSLTQVVQQIHPHVVHFIGHGKYEKEGGFLALVKTGDSDTAFWIKDDDLADCFRKREPRLIFLHACEGARSESYTSFRGLALKLVYSNIPAVVAMQYEVKNSVAIRFANKFYQSLGEGKPIDVAVQEGRLELGMFLDEEQNYSNRAFGSPVVYLQSAAGIIIAESQPKPDESLPPGRRGSETIQVLSSKVPCPYPGCRGDVVITNKLCVTCRRPLMQCPRGHVMAKNLGICGECGYEVESSAVRAAPEAVQQEAKPSMKPELQPSAGKKAGPLEPQPTGTFAAPAQAPS